MARFRPLGLSLVAVLLFSWYNAASEPDLEGYRTVDQAIRAAGPKAAPAAARPVYLGLSLATDADGKVTVADVAAGSPAARAGLQRGDRLLKAAGQPVPDEDALDDLLRTKAPNDLLVLTVERDGKQLDRTASLTTPSRPLSEPTAIQIIQGGKGAGGWDRRMTAWTKPVYRLGIILIEYPDQKHNPDIPPKAWEESMFSRGTYTKTNVTGQQVFGSLADYYWEQSFTRLKVVGKAFDYVQVSKKRAAYATGNRTALLTEALDKIIERDGKGALDGLDGVFYVYAGGRFQAARGSLYWPHRSTVSHKGKRWPYFICPEGGQRMGNISVFCHEFGHMLGLPDLYARPENPGMEGVGVWCAMANQVSNGRPQQFCAWSKERLGWIKPAVIDPTVKQKLILGPVEDSPKECYKVPVRPDGSEYFLLENRSKKGFDRSLPAEGLLIWRVVGGRPILEESHGVLGPSGPRVFLGAVPYPSSANDAFTPFTTPSSRSQLGGGLPVYITNIRRLSDGRITFHIGYEYQ